MGWDKDAVEIGTRQEASEALRDYLSAAYEYIDAVPDHATRNLAAHPRDPVPAGLDDEAEVRALQSRLAGALRHIDAIPRAVVDALAMPGFGRDDAEALVALDAASLSGAGARPVPR